MERRNEEPETINVWELMSGLDDDESSPRSVRFPSVSVAKHMPVSAALAAKLSADSFTLEEPQDVKPKSQWKPSRMAANAHEKLKGCAPEETSADVALHRNAQAKSRPLDGPPLNSSTCFSTVPGSNTTSTDILADDMQRSLSFKLTHNKEDKGILGLDDDLYSQYGKAFPGDFSTDSAIKFMSSYRPRVGESPPPSSGLSSSASVKLKKWFKATKQTLKQHTDRKGDSKTTGPETAPPKKPSWESKSSSKTSGQESAQSKKSSSESDSSDTVPSSPFGGPRRKGSSDLFELNADSNRECTALDQTSLGEMGQGTPIRRYRHSFTPVHKQLSSEENNQPPVNRASSWELEKVVANSEVKPVLYSTSSRVDINAYEDSNAVRAILISIVGSAFDEKSVSQHPHYEQELKKAINLPVVVVPTVCVRGKYIAGIDSIMQLFKKGILGSILVETLPHGLRPNSACLCKGGKFLICPLCKGKRKLIRPGEETVSCRHCIGTGLLKCPSCPKAQV